MLPAVLGACGDDEVDNRRVNKSVIIVGAGIAGLAAARELKARGAQVLLIESAARPGGRLRTNRSLGVAFDEGASWIHGPKGNPVTALAAASGAATYVTDDESLRVYDITGNPYSTTDLDSAYNNYEKALDSIAGSGTVDQSFQTVFNARYPQHVDNRLWTYMLSAYLEFDTGADLSRLSSLDFYNDEAFGGNDVIITNGYDAIADHLSAGQEIRLNERVTAIDHSGEKVNVQTDAGNYEANYVVVTVPLGILKQNKVTFIPALPQAKQQAISRVQMGSVNKFLLTWDAAFWDTGLQYVGYTPSQRGKFNYFMNVKKFSSVNALMTFAFGDYSLLTETMSDVQVVEAIMDHLRTIYGSSIPAPANMLRTRWNNDPNTYGAYSFATNGSRTTDFDILAEAVGNKLFFAGEHTSRDYRGTVHGAYLSGQREAEKIVGLQ